MRMRVIAVGTRMSGWVDTAFDDYARRLRSTMPLELMEIATANRKDAGAAAKAKGSEAARILATLGPREYVVALDERGREFSTVELSAWLEERRRGGMDLCFVIGGPDGLASEVLERSHVRWSLSRLTLPHGLVRVMLAEQLYRASTILAGHPYHRS